MYHVFTLSFRFFSFDVYGRGYTRRVGCQRQAQAGGVCRGGARGCLEGRTKSFSGPMSGFACLRHSPKHPSKGVGQLLKDDIILNYQLLV